MDKKIMEIPVVKRLRPQKRLHGSIPDSGLMKR